MDIGDCLCHNVPGIKPTQSPCNAFWTFQTQRRVYSVQIPQNGIGSVQGICVCVDTILGSHGLLHMQHFIAYWGMLVAVGSGSAGHTLVPHIAQSEISCWTTDTMNNCFHHRQTLYKLTFEKGVSYNHMLNFFVYTSCHH